MLYYRASRDTHFDAGIFSGSANIPTSTAAALPSYKYGANLSGMEYSPRPNGVNGTNFFAPNQSEYTYFKGKGFSIIRLPLDQARIQPVPYGPLNQANLSLITQEIEMARTTGMWIMLDLHTYGKDWSNVTNAYQAINIDPPVAAQPEFPYIDDAEFTDVWRRLTIVYQNYPNVIWGLQNEPNIQNPMQWYEIATHAIKAIRTVESNFGVTPHIISIPGTFFTTAATWTTDGSSGAWTGYADRRALQEARKAKAVAVPDEGGNSVADNVEPKGSRGKVACAA